MLAKWSRYCARNTFFNSRRVGTRCLTLAAQDALKRDGKHDVRHYSIPCCAPRNVLSFPR